MRRFGERIEWIFRHAVVYPIFRFLFRNKPYEGYVDISSVRSVLILRFDKLGDMIVTKPIFRALKRRNPTLHIGVVTSPSNAEILLNDACVDERYILYLSPFRMIRELMRARKTGYDVVLNFIFNRTTTAGIIANVVAPKGVKLGQGAATYRFYFNKMVKLDRSQFHMVEILAQFVSQAFGFGIDSSELDLFYEVDVESRRRKEEFVDTLLRSQRSGSRSYVVLNISARAVEKEISDQQAVALARYLSEDKKQNVILICAPEDTARAGSIESSVGSHRCSRYFGQGDAPIQDIAALLEGARCVLTPDTSIIHLASAMKVPVFGFYTPILVNHEWMPYRVHHQTIEAQPGQPVSSIPNDKLTAGVEAFLSGLDSVSRGGDFR